MIKKIGIALTAFAMSSSPVLADDGNIKNDPSRPVEIQPLPANPDFSELDEGVYRLPGNRCLLAVAHDDGGASGRQQVNIALACH